MQHGLRFAAAPAEGQESSGSQAGPWWQEESTVDPGDPGGPLSPSVRSVVEFVE